MTTPERPAVQIDVRGTHSHIGKTTIAAIITQALEAYGFSNITVNNPDHDFPEKMANTPTLGDFYLIPRVIINDSNQPLVYKQSS